MRVMLPRIGSLLSISGVCYALSVGFAVTAPTHQRKAKPMEHERKKPTGPRVAGRATDLEVTARGGSIVPDDVPDASRENSLKAFSTILPKIAAAQRSGPQKMERAPLSRRHQHTSPLRSPRLFEPRSDHIPYTPAKATPTS